jgi:hypothetical protein
VQGDPLDSHPGEEAAAVVAEAACAYGHVTGVQQNRKYSLMLWMSMTE